MDPVELITASRLLASGQPSQEALRRAISTAYYAMFHTLAISNAGLVVGAKAPANQAQWTRTYRSLRHNRAQDPLYGWPDLFTAPLQTFATTIAGLKKLREDADYDPNPTFSQNQVTTWINRAEQAIIDFNNTAPQERAMVAIATLA